MLSHELAAKYQQIPPILKERLAGENYELPEFKEDGKEWLSGFRVALITTHGPELPEFHVPVAYLRDRGASVDIITPDWLFNPELGEVAGMVVLAQWLAVNVCVKADKKISDVRPVDYDAVIVLGGAWNPIMLRTDDKVLKFICGARSRGILIAAICHGPQVLISADVFPKGTRVTGVNDIWMDLENAGFIIEDKWVVYDENQRLITSPNPQPEALKHFCEEIGKQARCLIEVRV